MGYIGYYMKKDKWWGYLILFPMIIMNAFSYSGYLSNFIFSYPKYILIVLFCISMMIIYPLYIFNNKKIKTVGVVISSIIIIIITIYNIIKPPVYNTQILSSNEENYFDGEVTFKDGLPRTTKGNEDIHGFGTKSISLISKKYKGEVSFYSRGDVFSLDILFNDKKIQKLK